MEEEKKKYTASAQVEQARQEHRSKVAGGYKCPIPKDVVPGVCRLEH